MAEFLILLAVAVVIGGIILMLTDNGEPDGS
jgi:hypothetical protein